jgi:hypothetical protein
MDRVDVLGRLRRLNESLDRLGEDDKGFVSEMVKLHESGQRLNRPQILRIVDMQLPGELDQQQDKRGAKIWTFGMVNVLSVSPDERVWRYMSLERLFALLSNKALHFSPLAAMSDTSEGKLPPKAWEETKKQLPSHLLEEGVGMGGDTGDALTAIMVEQRRTDACVSCWYIDSLDSLGMWQEYAPNNGVAIQSTLRRLGSSLRDSSTPVVVSPVRYFGPNEEEAYSNEAFYGSLYIKNDKFRHEKECRALAYRVNMGSGFDIPAKVDDLIERLVLSPELRDWAVPFITEAIRRFDFDGPIEKSKLKTTP